MSNTIMTASLNWQALEAKRALLAERQASFNDLARTGATTAIVEDAIRSHADEEHLAYLQYRGHWDGWTLAKIRRRIETKAGICFEPGDVVLVAVRQRWRTLIVDVSDTVYSVRVGSDVAVTYWDIERLA